MEKSTTVDNQNNEFTKPFSLSNANQASFKQSEFPIDCSVNNNFPTNTSTDYRFSEEERQIDPKCIYEIKTRLVRVQYPGRVNNVDKAIETLGGLYSIEMAVGENNPLRLSFHPQSIYNKHSVSEKDHGPGLLLKVKMKIPKTQNTDSSDFNNEPIYEYEVLGATVVNFTFNKLVDFQYLPLVANYPESSVSDVNYLYKDLLPHKLPTLEWLKKIESQNMPLFLTPLSYARFDLSKQKLYVSPVEKYDNRDRPELVENFKSLLPKNKPDKIISQAFGRNSTKKSIFHNFNDKEVPQCPLDEILFIIKKKNLGDALIKLQRFFEDRPIWSKAGLQYNSKLGNETIKIVLPAVAYYVVTGPWRSMWVQFGYDPRKDPNSRQYQSLDYRIRTSVGNNLVINAKRTYSTKAEKYTANVKKVSLKDLAVKKKNLPDENSYILRPNTLPPARQMFYQYCDILLPEVQTMLDRLPSVPSNTKCTLRNGWFPGSFVDHCREIVNRYVAERVQNEILQEKRLLLETSELPKIKQDPALNIKPSDYSSLMIKNIRRGFYNQDQPSTSGEQEDVDEDILEILDSDDEIMSTRSVIDDIPERLEDSDNELVYDDSHELVEYDMEALEDVKKIICSSFKNKK